MKLQNQQQSHGRIIHKRNQGILETREFLLLYPKMVISPSSGSDLILKGIFEFSTKCENFDRIVDSYKLEIRVPPNYPKELPVVKEIGNKIPRKGKYHVNENGSLCLGSPLRLLWMISKNTNLCGFAEYCLEPYLYSISCKLKYGDFPFSELDHGSKGELEDYVDLFGLKNPEQAKDALHLLGMKKRLANKKPCPCGCNIRLGKCKFNYKLREFRNLAERSWFRSQISNEDLSR